MITDWETNTVYYSYQSNFDFKPELKKLRKIINNHGFKHHHIAGTKDYFCRDYMPVQLTKNEFIQFKFQPDYLLNDPERIRYVTDTKSVLRKNRFLDKKQISTSEIILDGGNIIKSKNNVIITDKVCIDNNLTREEVKNKLEELLKVNVIIISRYPGEETGHADGIIRFINENTVLTINLENEKQDWKNKILKELKNEKLDLISLPKAKSPDKDWRYINYLQIGQKVIVPAFDNESDKIILPFLKELFEKSGMKMEILKAKNIAKNGGVLNCFTWNILE